MAFLLKKNDPAQAKKFFEDKLEFTTGPVEVKYAQDQKLDFNLIDVRAAEDFNKGHPIGAINLPENDWNSFRGLSKDKANVLLCYSQQCHLAARAAVVFAGAGYSVIEMDGGFEAWKEHELPVETGKTRAA